MKVSATLKGRADEFDRKQVTLRIADGNTRKFKVTDIRVNPKDFSKGLVKASHPDHTQLNRKILHLIMEVEREGHFGALAPIITFNDYAMQLLNQWDKQKHWDTLRHYKSSLNKFNEFAPGIALNKVDSKLLQAFREYCVSLGNKPNTVWTTFRFMRLIIRKAIKDELITVNPLNRFEMPKYKDPQKNYLTDDQIKVLEKIRVQSTNDIHFALTWFLIGIETGLRYGDMHKFNRKKHIKNNRLVVYTGKTNEVIGMPFSKRAAELLASIDYRPMAYTNEHFNRLLKTVTEMAEFDEKITAHQSRHTAAVRWANAGISQEVTAVLLGHRSQRTTAIYYKITNKRIDDELKKIR